MSVRVVTVSREFGSGGKEFGHVLAGRLGWDYVDSRLVDEVAQRMQCPEDVVQRWDERGEGVILRLLRAMQAAHPEAVAPGPIGPALLGNDPSPERVAAVVREMIAEEARRGHAVIVGRGAAWVLAEEPGVLHVRLVGDRADRIARLADRLSSSRENATKLVDQTDRERVAYLKHHFGVDPRDPHHFDLVFNTSRVEIAWAIRVVERMIRGDES
ncbi:MAG: cytidylate kinase-like family protein [Candidatus Eisenbacteria bacterium]